MYPDSYTEAEHTRALGRLIRDMEAQYDAFVTREDVDLALTIIGDGSHDRLLPLGVDRLRQIVDWMDEATKGGGQ